jgi:hypothetical protein
MAEDIVKGSIAVSWPVWTMMASWLGAMVDNLKEEGCMTEDAAALMRRNLVHGIALATEALKNEDMIKMNMARDIIIGVLHSVVDAIESCDKVGDKP